jgi:hypothetical protein
MLDRSGFGIQHDDRLLAVPGPQDDGPIIGPAEVAHVADAGLHRLALLEGAGVHEMDNAFPGDHCIGAPIGREPDGQHHVLGARPGDPGGIAGQTGGELDEPDGRSFGGDDPLAVRAERWQGAASLEGLLGAGAQRADERRANRAVLIVPGLHPERDALALCVHREMVWHAAPAVGPERWTKDAEPLLRHHVPDLHGVVLASGDQLLPVRREHALRRPRRVSPRIAHQASAAFLERFGALVGSLLFCRFLVVARLGPDQQQQAAQKRLNRKARHGKLQS